MEAQHEGMLVRQHHPSPNFRISNSEGTLYRIQRVQGAPSSFTGTALCCRSVYVSKAHCEISRRDRTYWIKDIGSQNGTYLNGVKITTHCERELRFGDMLGIGVSHDGNQLPAVDFSEADKYFVFKFQQAGGANVELVDFDDDDIQIVCEVGAVTKSVNSASSSSSRGSSSKRMPPPPPPPPPIISKAKKPTPSSSASSSVDTSYRGSKSKESTPKSKKSLQSDDDPNKSDHEPKKKRIKRTSHSSSDDSSDGLGDVSHPTPKSSSAPANALRESYSGVSTGESSSSDSEDNDRSISPPNGSPEVRSKSPNYKSHKNNFNLPVASHSKAIHSSKPPKPKITARKSTCPVPEHIKTKQKLRKLRREAAKLEALKREAVEKPCSVKLHNIIIQKDGIYVVIQKVFELLKYQAIIKRVQMQFRNSLSQNERNQRQHSDEPHQNSGKSKDTEAKNTNSGRKKIIIQTISSSSSSSESESESENVNTKKVLPKRKPLAASSDSENENDRPKKLLKKTKPLFTSPESDSENENIKPKKLLKKAKPLSSLSESHFESEDAKSKKTLTKSSADNEPTSPRPRDLRVSSGSISDVSDVDLPSDEDQDKVISKQTNSVPPVASSTPVERPPPNPRRIQLLADAPLPKFAARAQEKAALFKAPMPSTSFYKAREKEMSKSQKTTPVTEREFQYMTKEDQKKVRNQRLKEVEMKKQQEREQNMMVEQNKPKPAANIKVKVTKRNRNQDLMEDIVGEQFKDTDSVIGGIKENYESAHTSYFKATELDATKTGENATVTRPTGDPRIYTKQVEKDINDALKASTSASQLFNFPLPTVTAVPVPARAPQPPPPAIAIAIHNGANRNLKPGAQVIMSPPMKVGTPNYKESENILSAGNFTLRKQHMPENDIYRRICEWLPQWIEEQRFMKEQPPQVTAPFSFNMTLTAYVNFQAYFNTYYPLLLSEIWASISDENESRTRRNEESSSNRFITEYPIKIDTIKMTETCPLPFSKNKRGDAAEADKIWAIITYHAWTRHEYEINSKRNLLTLSVHGTIKESNSKLRKQLFCFSDFNSEKYDKVDGQQGNCDQRLKKQSDATFKGPGYRYTETIVCKLGTKFFIDLTTIGTIKRHVYLTSQIKEFRALNELQSMRLYSHIVSPPEIQAPWKPPSESGSVDQHNMISLCLQLNPDQRSMVKHVTNRVFSRVPELMLMHGPPGTGKTKTIVALIMQLLETCTKQKLPPYKQRILVCTPSNAAIDEIMRRLIEAKKTLPAGRKVELLRIGDNYSESSEPYSLNAKVKAREENNANTRSLQVELTAVENDIEEITAELNDLKERNAADPIIVDSKSSYLRELESKKRQLLNDLHPSRKKKDSRNLNDQRKQDVIRDAQIICTTLCSSSNSQLKNALVRILQNNQKPFLCCIVDEASQTTEPETLLPLVYNVDKLLLVGDPEQLGATVRSSVAETKGYGQSLFTRLYKFYSRKTNNPVMMLQRQYRMHHDIVKWPNSYCYEGKLQTSYTPPSNSDRLTFPRPYYFLNMSSGRQSKTEGQIENVDEVEMVKVLLDTLEGILSETKMAWSVGIITPYAAQKAVIAKEVKGKSFRYLKSVEVDTVDGFQGQERDIIILSCVRTDGTGFLKSKSRLNVALTRAKHCLYIIGDARNLLKESMWCSLIKNAAERNCKYDVNPDFRLNLAVLKDALTSKLKEKPTK